MFYLSKIEHTIPLPPHLLSRPLVGAIKEQLEKLFLDKVASYIRGMAVLHIRLYLDQLCSDHLLGRFLQERLRNLALMVCVHPCQLGPDDIWTWTYDSSELPLDLEEKIRFRIKSIKYPPLPIEQDADAKPFAPMEITAEICADGLGLVSWWEE
ncbi:uncharacterized protein LOC109827813 isoform X2 [Asparagus officinalis]|uniref:uncharacterized protein LOC109827813 isoform X2 n=1 Tax=Asparagus officinalis TaxID=4686 RepID=UPI00098E1FDE|nr:uncharacterized protein LOC109827813 isoform X2 [Asparagus officinalis]